MNGTAVQPVDPLRRLTALGVLATQRLLADYRAHVASLAVSRDAKRLRERSAEQLIALHPDLSAWLRRPTPARLADLQRSRAWPLLCWAAVHAGLPLDVDLILAKRQGDLYVCWASEHASDTDRLNGVGATLGWSAGWTRQISVVAHALVCLHSGGKPLSELVDEDFTSCVAALLAAPSLSATLRSHSTARVFSLHQACYQLRICQQPPRMSRAPALTIEQRLTADISQREIRTSRCATSRWSRRRCGRAR